MYGDYFGKGIIKQSINTPERFFERNSVKKGNSYCSINSINYKMCSPTALTFCAKGCFRKKYKKIMVTNILNYDGVCRAAPSFARVC